METKVCNQCKIAKPLYRFKIKKGNKRKGKCKYCTALNHGKQILSVRYIYHSHINVISNKNILEKQWRKELSDRYIKQLLHSQDIDYSEVTQEMIDIKRKQLKLTRYVKQQSNTSSTKGN